jgi:hypothetical protein
MLLLDETSHCDNQRKSWLGVKRQIKGQQDMK